MSKRKNCYKKMILPLLASSLVLSSCEKDDQTIITLNMDNFAEDAEDGTILLPIQFYLGDSYSEKIKFIDLFVTNILSNHNEASEFSKDQKSILKKYKLDDIDLDMNSPEIQILFALADPDILNAIESNDVSKYIQLLQEKRLFHTDSLKNNLELLRKYPITKAVDSDNFAPVVICFLGAAIYVALATVAETVVMVHSGFAMWGADSNSLATHAMNNLVDTNVIKIWQLKGNEGHTYDITDEIQSTLIKLSQDVAKQYKLSEEEQQCFYEIAVGMVNIENKTTK